MTLTHERLLELVSYDPLTGVFTWKVKPNRKILIGQRAGCLCRTHGYRLIKVDGVMYRENRLAWFYMEKNFPELDVEHENRIRDDNRWANLREATRSQNLANRVNSLPVSGYPGVTSNGTGWAAMLFHKGQSLYLGQFHDPKIAHEAVKRKHREIYGEFSIYAKEEHDE